MYADFPQIGKARRAFSLCELCEKTLRTPKESFGLFVKGLLFLPCKKRQGNTMQRYLRASFISRRFKDFLKPAGLFLCAFAPSRETKKSPADVRRFSADRQSPQGFLTLRTLRKNSAHFEGVLWTLRERFALSSTQRTPRKYHAEIAKREFY
jgi:hypothetical protein